MEFGNSKGSVDAESTSIKTKKKRYLDMSGI